MLGPGTSLVYAGVVAALLLVLGLTRLGVGLGQLLLRSHGTVEAAMRGRREMTLRLRRYGCNAQGKPEQRGGEDLGHLHPEHNRGKQGYRTVNFGTIFRW